MKNVRDINKNLNLTFNFYHFQNINKNFISFLIIFFQLKIVVFFMKIQFFLCLY